MSRVGAWSGAAALVIGAVLVGAWDVGASPSAAPTPPDGARLFMVKGCSACHVGPDSTAAAGSAFPPLDAAAQWAGDRQPGVSAEDYLARSMVAPDAFISPGVQRGQLGQASAMPVLTLTTEEVDSLIGYLLEE